MRETGGEGGSGWETGGEGGSGFRASGSGGPIIITDPLDVRFEAGEYNKNAVFPERAWRPDLLALLVLPEFCKTNWQAINVPTPTSFRDPSMDGEIARMLDKFRTDRRRLAAEIFAQDSGIADYFAHLLTLKPSTHPQTFVVIHMALKVGQLAAVHFKKIHNRARPQHVNPALIPLIPPPAHPSYPSAHSTESFLIALALGEVVPGARKLLNTLAYRIAVNREVAGVHFESDTAAGRELAGEVFKRLHGEENAHQGCKIFQDTVEVARKEHEPQWYPPSEE